MNTRVTHHSMKFFSFFMRINDQIISNFSRTFRDLFFGIKTLKKSFLENYIRTLYLLIK
jgi:hypothetical protein